MLKRFFKPKWQNPDPTIRKQAIDQLILENDQATLKQIALTDEIESIRQLALTGVNDTELLKDLLEQATASGEWFFLAGRLSESAFLDPLVRQFLDKKNAWTEDDYLKNISECQSLSLAKALLLALNEARLWSQLALTAKSVELKLFSLEQVDQLENLSFIVKNSSYKPVIQAAKTKLKVAKDELQRLEALHQQAISLTHALEKLASQTWLDPQLEIKMGQIVKQWQGLDADPVKELEPGFAQALAACQAIADNNRKAIEQANLEKEAAQKQQALFEQIGSLVRQIDEGEITEAGVVQSLMAARQLLEESWQQCSVLSKPSPEQNGRFYGALDKLTHFIKCWEKYTALESGFEALHSQLPEKELSSLTIWLESWNEQMVSLHWPKEYPVPQKLLDWQQTQKQLQAVWHDLAGLQQKKLGQLNRKLSLLSQHIANKNLIKANKLLNYIHNLQQALQPGFAEPFALRLQVIMPALDELRDWHLFATTPKKQALCEAMEALLTHEQPPLERAKQVRALQNEWHELAASDAEADQAFWERFKTASDAAYAPCLAFYAEKDAIKAQNLEKKLSLINQLEQFLKEQDWDKTDRTTSEWKEIDHYFSQVNQDWQAIHPIPDNEKKSVQKRFYQLCDQLKQKLSDEKNQNLALRQELIAKAEKLVALENSLEATEQAKNLQQQWKTLGVTFAKADHEAWRDFRSALDQVFKRRDLERKQFKSDLSAHAQQIKSLTGQIEVLAKLPDAELKSSYADYEALKKAWDDSLTLPKATAKQLKDQFYNACQNYQKNYAGIESRRTANALNHFFEALCRIEQAEQQLLGGEGLPEQSVEKMLSSQDFTDVHKTWLQARIEALSASEPKSNLAGLSRLSDQLLQTEILLGLDSPKDCKKERMTRQLEMLKNGQNLASTLVEKAQVIDAMLQLWAEVGFIQQPDRNALRPRFEAILKLQNP